MEQRLALSEYGKHLWTRDMARGIRKKLVEIMDGLSAGDVLVIDAKGVEVFDFSFANELFGKTVLSLSGEYPGRFTIVEHLTEYARENLVKALESMNLAMIERKGRKVELLGKASDIDAATFEAILKAHGPVTAASLKDELDLNINAMNERLTKLANLGLIRRDKTTSSAGREQYEYKVMR